MNAEVKRKWLEALRSGEYKQGRRKLRRKTETGDKFCCLGVLCELAVDEGIIQPPTNRINDPFNAYAYDEEESILPKKVASWAGLSEAGIPLNIYNSDESVVTKDFYHLPSRNDSGETFEEIADFIEEHL